MGQVLSREVLNSSGAIDLILFSLHLSILRHIQPFLYSLYISIYQMVELTAKRYNLSIYLCS